MSTSDVAPVARQLVFIGRIVLSRGILRFLPFPIAPTPSKREGVFVCIDTTPRTGQTERIARTRNSGNGMRNQNYTILLPISPKLT
ncbi:hypothetical protein [Thalassoglobus neptunius]|uniref:hypothetical protein n=1 Tax=Thalassoglobus neptunius TaxID=1938619 RepID=UPI0011B564A3|nr:hypothetical protein [Thalassoglobus neptunius]